MKFVVYRVKKIKKKCKNKTPYYFRFSTKTPPSLHLGFVFGAATTPRWIYAKTSEARQLFFAFI